MGFLPVSLYVVAGCVTLNAWLVVTKVGEPRQPYTGQTAAINMLFAAFYVTISVLAAMKLGT